MTTKEKTQKELVPVAENQVAVAHNGPVEGLEAMGQSDLLLSTYTIVQPTSRGDKGKLPAGHFYDNLTGKATEVVQCVILRISPSRTLWGEVGERTPICVSYDGVRGTVYGTCAKCSFNRWSKDPKDQVCKAGYLLIAANMEDSDNIFLFRAMGSSVRAIKALYTQLVGIGRNTGRPAFGHQVKLDSKLAENDKGKYYTLETVIVQPLSPEQTAHYRELYIMLGGADIADAEARANIPEEVPTPVNDDDIF